MLLQENLIGESDVEKMILLVDHLPDFLVDLRVALELTLKLYILYLKNQVVRILTLHSVRGAVEGFEQALLPHQLALGVDAHQAYFWLLEHLLHLWGPLHPARLGEHVLQNLEVALSDDVDMADFLTFLENVLTLGQSDRLETEKHLVNF